MYRVTKALNHNAVLAIEEDGAKEYLILGKEIGFGKKVSEYVSPTEDCHIYSLQNGQESQDAETLIQNINPKYLEIANAILDKAEKEFGEVDRSILFPMADHISFAVKRMQKGEKISNPLTQDIQILFYKEYKIAMLAKDLIEQSDHITIDEHEVGYIALHVHSSICDEKVSNAMQIAAAVRECISMIEQDTGKNIDVQTISYNRLMNHIKYMAARALTKEELKLNMNDYIAQQFPNSFRVATTVCNHLEHHLKVHLPDIEIGYLAMHIERVYSEQATE